MLNLIRLQTRTLLFAVILPFACLGQEADPPEVAIGERLFLETRFAQFFFTNCAGNVNSNLPAGDPVVDSSTTTGEPLAGPFAGLSMNCRACHLVDEQPGRRTYDDFARRSPIPERGDGQHTTPRNSPSLLGVQRFGTGGPLLHMDGEFVNAIELVKGTFSGRNFGWLPGERRQAVAHIAKVIREDDGTDALAQQFGGSYRAVFAADPGVPAEFHLPRRFRMNVAQATDDQIFDGVSRLVAAYLNQLQLSRTNRRFIGSPFDLFLRKNGMPVVPAAGQADAAFANVLLKRLERLAEPKFVTTNDGRFISHDQGFVFGEAELAGLKMFLRREPAERQAAGAGNCIACHAPPRFTDLSFHNTGATQVEYNTVHGPGAFSALHIPSLAERATNFDAWLPATAAHPDAVGPYRAAAQAGHPLFTDLGVWNIFANPDCSRTHPYLKRALRQPRTDNRMEAMLARSVARFKTPSLRDLGHSGPYLHNGSMDTIEAVLQFYQATSAAAQGGTLRNADPELLRIHLSHDDIAPLAAFLRSLNEDYE